MQSVQKRCNNLLAQSCKEADALGNLLQREYEVLLLRIAQVIPGALARIPLIPVYGKVLLVDVEQPNYAALMSELRPLV